MSNPSTVWAQLAFPNLASGSIPFVYSDSVTIGSDVGHLWYNQPAYQLSVNCPFDQTGSDSLNTYYNQDTYWPYNSTSLTNAQYGYNTNGTTAAHTVSSSRGTGTVPTVSLDGDFIGKFSGWAYTGVTPKYTEIAGIEVYAQGAPGGLFGAGGRLVFFTKTINSTVSEWLQLDNQGNFGPVSSIYVSLGTANNGWGAFYLTSVIQTIPSIGSLINSPAGKFKMSSGITVFTLANSHISPNAIVHCMMETVDPSGAFIKAVTPAAGSATITLSAVLTNPATINFFVIQTDT